MPPGQWNTYDRLGDVIDALTLVSTALAALTAEITSLRTDVLAVRDRLPASLDNGRLRVKDTSLL